MRHVQLATICCKIIFWGYMSYYLKTDEQLQFFVNSCVGLAVLSYSLQESKDSKKHRDPPHPPSVFALGGGILF
jgi:hypothetical protein